MTDVLTCVLNGTLTFLLADLHLDCSTGHFQLQFCLDLFNSVLTFGLDTGIDNSSPSLGA